MYNSYDLQRNYTIADLLRIMDILRGDDGCPWDREQDHHSIRNNLLEEAYEAADAIDRDHSEDLQEELGDVLLQVVFHARMSEEAGDFDFNGVCDRVCKKLILRHPHVFGDGTASTSSQVLERWDEIKKVEKGQETALSTLESVPRSFPALMRAAKVCKRAGKTGYEQSQPSALTDKLLQQVEALQAACQTQHKDEQEQALGALLFEVAKVAQKIHCDPEEALTRRTDSFIRQFGEVERSVVQSGKELAELNSSEWDKLMSQNEFRCE